MLVDPAAELAALVGSLANSLVVVANNSLSNKSSEVVLGVPADTLNSESDVSSRHAIISDTDVRTHEVSLLLGSKVGAGLGST